MYCRDITPFDFAESELFFRERYIPIIIFFMGYLLIVLFIVVDLVNVFRGTIRKVYVFEVF